MAPMVISVKQCYDLMGGFILIIISFDWINLFYGVLSYDCVEFSEIREQREVDKIISLGI